MESYLVPGIIAALAVLLLVLKTNTAVLFFVVCGGSVLLTASGRDISLVIASMTVGSNLAGQIGMLAALLLPVAVAALFMRGTMRGAKLPLAVLPAVATAFLLVVLAVPLLPYGAGSAVLGSPAWERVGEYRPAIVLLGVVTSTFVIALTVRATHSADKHKKAKH